MFYENSLDNVDIKFQNNDADFKKIDDDIRNILFGLTLRITLMKQAGFLSPKTLWDAIDAKDAELHWRYRELNNNKDEAADLYEEIIEMENFVDNICRSSDFRPVS